MASSHVSVGHFSYKLKSELTGTINKLQKRAHLVRCGKKARFGVATRVNVPTLPVAIASSVFV